MREGPKIVALRLGALALALAAAFWLFHSLHGFVAGALTGQAWHLDDLIVSVAGVWAFFFLGFWLLLFWLL